MSLSAHNTNWLVGDYVTDRSQLVKAFENGPLFKGQITVPRAHSDGVVSIAIGYGFDLLKQSISEINSGLAAVGLASISPGDIALINIAKPKSERLGDIAQITNLTAALKQEKKQLLADLSSLAHQMSLNLLDEQHASDLLANSMSRFEARFDADIAARYGLVIPQSRERAVLVSMAYNTGSGSTIFHAKNSQNAITGPSSLVSALMNDDRARAWYEIRYNSSFPKERGLVRRRFAEAHLFGLYSDENQVSLKDALGAYRMYSDPGIREKIKAYELKWGNDLYESNTQVGYYVNGSVSIDRELREAANVIIDHFIGSETGPHAIGVEDIFVGDDTDYYVRGEVKFSKEDLLVGNERNNLIIGGKGNDYLKGGRGDDIYAFDEGWGTDVIDDVDTSGHILISGQDLPLGKKQSDGVWQSEDGAYRYVLIDQGDSKDLLVMRLVSGDNLIIRNWSDGGFDIQLSDELAEADELDLPGSTLQGDQDWSTSGAPIHVGPGSYLAWWMNTAPYNPANPEDDFLFTGFRVGAGQVGTLIGGLGKDILIGDTIANSLDGGDGDDQLFGGAGADVLKGGDGKDILLGGVHYHDFTVTGGGAYEDGTLIYFPSINIPLITTDNFDSYDKIRIRGANTTQEQSDGDDVMDGGVGNDIMDGGYGDDRLKGGADNDLMFGGAGKDFLEGGANDDRLYGDSTTPLSGETSGNDILVGGSGNNMLFGQGGNDTLVAGTGNDLLMGDYFDSAITPTVDHGDDVLDGGAGQDVLIGGGGQDILLGGDGSDKLYGDNVRITDALKTGLQTVNAHFFDHQAAPPDTGRDAADMLFGGAGNDLLYGGGGNDTLSGDANNDTLYGGAGSDTYLIDGQGDDRIVDRDSKNNIVFQNGFVMPAPGSSGIPAPLLESIESYTDENGNAATGKFLVIPFANSGTKLKVLGGYSLRENFQLADGATMDAMELIAASGTSFDTPYVDDGAPRIIGTSGDDTLIAAADAYEVLGAKGNDTISLNNGGNTLYYGIGDGTDHVSINRAAIDPDVPNILKFGPGITADDLKLGLGSLAIQVGSDPNDVIHIENFDPNNVYGSHAFDQFEFTDGTVLSYEELLQQGFDIIGSAADNYLSGTNVDDRIRGREGDDWVEAGEGNDVLAGEGGNDTLIAGLGNDDLAGGEGNDTLDGGVGDDVYIGGSGDDVFSDESGSDTYYYQLGDGNDTIADTESAEAEEIDTLLLGDGIAPSSLHLTPGVDSLAIQVGESLDDVIHIENFNPSDVYGSRAIDRIEFSDGTVLTYQELLADGFDIAGDEEGNYLAGTNIDDRIDAKGGNDLIITGEGNNRIDAGTGNDEVFAGSGNDILLGGDGNDWLVAGLGDNSLSGGTGDDALFGDAGSDSYYYQLGDGNDIIIETDSVGAGGIDTLYLGEGIALSSLQFQRNYHDLKLNIVDADSNVVGSITLQGFLDSPDNQIETVSLADGTQLSAADLIAQSIFVEPPGDYFWGGDDADEIIASEGADYVDAGWGDDIVQGDKGDDTLDGGSWTAMPPTHLEGGYGDPIELRAFTDNDQLEGGEGNDRLDGGYSPDHDVLIGGTGDDTYLLHVGSGDDTVVESAEVGSDDVILIQDATPDQVHVTRDATDLIIEIRITDDAWGNRIERIRVANHYVDPTARIERVIVDNYDDPEQPLAIWDVATLEAMAEAATNLDDYLIAPDTGGTLAGGAGNDVLVGGMGADTYQVATQEGIDTIRETSDTAAYDVLQLGDGIAANAVRVFRDGNDLLLTTGSLDHRVVLESWFTAPEARVEAVQFADGTTWSAVELEQHLQPTATEEADLLFGDSQDNVLDGSGGDDRIDGRQGFDELRGGEGNDQLHAGSDNDLLLGDGGDDALFGEEGDDQLSGGTGDDVLAGGQGDDTYHYAIGDGHDVIDDTSGFNTLVLDGVAPEDSFSLRRSTNDNYLHIDFADGGSIRVANWDATNEFAIQSIRFADGSEWQWWDIAENTLGAFTPYFDWVYGTERDDVLDGLGGGDVIYGSGGDDTYVFAPGYASLSIREWGDDRHDRLLFKDGIRFSDLTFSADQASLIITVGDTAERVVIDYFFEYFFDFYGATSATGLGKTIESLVFDDGSPVELGSLTFGFPVAKDLYSATYYGYGADDSITGTDEYDTIFGGAGQDHLDGGDGFDTLYGGSGNDQLTGGGATSVAARASQIVYDTYGSTWGFVDIPGYRGSAYGRADALAGGAGDDTYLVNENSGMVVIQDTSGNDVIQLGSNIDLGSLVAAFNPTNHSGQIRIEYQDGNGLASAIFLNTNSSIKFIRSATGESIAISDLPQYVRAQVNGTSGSDVLITGLGPQTINGNDGNDLVAGGAGRDTLNGGAGSDLLVGGDGNDILADFTLPNVLVGGTGSDAISGNGELFGGSGNDTLDGYGLIDGGTGNDTLKVRTVSATSFGTQVYSAIVFGRGYGQDVLPTGGTSNAYIVLKDLMPADVTILGLPTTRGTPSMTLQVNGTEDRLVGIDNIKRIQFADGSFWTAEDMSRVAQAPVGTVGNDTLNGTARPDEIHGLAGDDYIQAGAGDDVILGGAGRDILLGESGNDQLDGGDASVDLLNGGAGEDTYFLRLGQGEDYILEVAYLNQNGYTEFSSNPNLSGFDIYSVAAPDGKDTLIQVESGIAPEDIVVLRNETDLFIQATDATTGTARLVLKNWLMRSEAAGPVRLRFADGTEWSEALLLEKCGATYSEWVGFSGYSMQSGSPSNDVLNGTASANTLSGYAGDDVLDGGAGNDVLIGGEGRDTYLFGVGSGHDRIESYDDTPLELDVIQLKAGVRPQDVTIRLDGQALVIDLAGGSDSLTLSSWVTSNTNHRINQLRFEDGYLLNLSGDPQGPLELTDGSDTHSSGGYYDDIIYGMDGGDVINGRVGSDQLHGGAGDDYLSGGQGSNRLEGGLGNDTLISEASEQYYNTTDTIVVGRNTGQDFVSFTGLATLAGSLIVEFQSDVAASEVRVGLVGQPSFASATVVKMLLSLSVDGGDTQLLGLPLQLDLSSDVLTLPVKVVFADGQEWTGAEVLERALVNRQGAWGNFFAGDNAHASEFRGSQQVDYMVGLNNAETMIGQSGGDWLIGGGGNDQLYGGEDNDILAGGSGDDQLSGGHGNDTLRGGAGRNTYVFERQFGYDELILDALEHATLQFDSTISAKDVVFQVSGKDLIVTLAGEGGNQLTIKDALTPVDLGSVGGTMVRCNLEAIQFGDGEFWSTNQILNRLGFYSAADDVLIQQAGNFILSGGLGDDALTGGAANDQLNGSEGNDALAGSTGNDLLLGGVGNDHYFFNAGDGTDEIRDAGSTADSRDTLVFGRGIATADVTRTIQGNDITLTVSSNRGAVIIRGGMNADLAIERVLFADGTVLNARTWQSLPSLTLAAGAGEVILSPEQQLSRLVFGEGILPDQVGCARAGDDLVMSLANDSDRWVLQGWFRDSAPTVLVAMFTTGEFWSADDLARRASTLTGTDGADQLSAPARIATTLQGAGGDDVLVGGVKSDLLLGGDGNDRLDGGFGGDRLQGGAGDDTYLVDNMADVIVEQVGEGRDRVVSSVSLTLADNVEDLMLSGSNAVNGEGNALDNALTGNALDNRLIGGDGNDRLDGGAGADYLSGGLGNDSYYIDNLADTLDENNGGGTDTVYSAITHTLTGNFENLTLIGSGLVNGTGNQNDNILRGNAENNQLYGLSGNDTLDGGAGADQLTGGSGDDRYYVDNVNDLVLENAGEGTDTVFSSISLALGNTLENLTLTETANINAIGNPGKNELIGNSGKNLLDGGVGDDTLDGGAGDDTLVGGSGNDTYRFRLQGGIDTVSDATDVNTGVGDRVEFDSNIAPDAVTLTWRQNDLVIAVKGAADRMIVQNLRTDTSPFSLVFPNSATWSRTDILSRANSAPANSAPQLQSGIGDMGLTTGVTFSTVLPATVFNDADAGDTLAWRLTLADGSPLPSWLQFDPTTLQLSGTPGANNVGLYTLRASVMDAGALTASTGFLLNIRASTNPNHPPVVTVSPEHQSAIEGERFQFLVPSSLFSDADVGDAVTLSAALADGSALPAWLSFDAQIGEFSGVPTSEAAGTWQIQLRGTDKAGDFATSSFEFVVADRNMAPVANQQIADVLVGEDQPFSLAIPADLFTDRDGDELSYSVKSLDGQSLPDWLHFDPTTRLLTGMPGRNEIGATTVAIVAADGQGHATEQRFDVVVRHVNHAPVATSPTVTFDITEGQQLLDAWSTDFVVDQDRGDQLTYTLVPVSASAGPDYPAHPLNRPDLLGSYVLSADLYENLASKFATRVTNYWDIGTWTYLLTVTDRSGESSQQTITINVNPSDENHTPYLRPFTEGGIPQYWQTGANVISASHAVGEQVTAHSITITPDLFFDVDDDALIFGVVEADGSNSSSNPVLDMVNHSISFTVENAEARMFNFLITATDEHGAVAYKPERFILNQAPVRNEVVPFNPVINIQEDSSFSITLPDNLFIDLDGDPVKVGLGFTLSNDPWPSFLQYDSATRTLWGQAGDYDVRTYRSAALSAGDPYIINLGALPLTINVLNTYDAPRLVTTLNDVLLISGQSLTVNTGVAFREVDADQTLTYSATLVNGEALPTWLTINPLTGLLRGTPTGADVGNISLRVSATDLVGGVASDELVITVNPVQPNHAPTLSQPIADRAYRAAAQFNFALPQGTFTDVDPYDALTYQATLANGSPLPSWLHFNAATQSFSGTIPSGLQAPIAIAVKAYDKFQASASGSFTLGLATGNSAPYVLSPIAPVNAQEGAVLTWRLPSNTFADDDVGEVLTYTITQTNGAALPAWLQFDPVTRTLQGMPQDADTGSLSLKVTATDSLGAIAIAPLTLEVVGVNEAPALVQAPVLPQAVQGQALSYQIPANTFHDGDKGDSLRYVLTQSDGTVLPTWLTFDAATRTLSGTPANADVGALSLRLVATDQSGASAAAAFVLDVANVNDAPVTAVASVGLNEDQIDALQGNLLTAAHDIDVGDVLTAIAATYQGLYGALTVNADGSWRYQPANASLQLLAAGEQALDRFTYQVSDGQVMVPGELRFLIDGRNDVPVVTLDQGSLGEDQTQLTGNVLANDQDVDRDAQLAVAQSGGLQGSYGALQLNTDGSYVYTLDTAAVQSLRAGESVVDHLTYGVTDGQSTTGSALDITIVGANDAPQATADEAALSEDDAEVIGTVLGNDHDVDHDTVLEVLVPGQLQGQYGVLTLSRDGGYRYQLDNAVVQHLGADQSLTESFAYQVTDGQLQAASSLTITINGRNDAPVATDDAASLQEDGLLVATGNVLANDSDVDSGTMLVVSSAGALQGLYGQLVIDAAGSYRYELANASAAVQALAEGETVAESFQYVVADGSSDGRQPATAMLMVQVAGRNDAPVTLSDQAVLTEDEAGVDGNVVGNDHDIDRSDVLAITAGTLQGEYGVLQLAADGEYHYTLDTERVQSLGRDQHHSDTFHYQVTDGHAVVSDTLTITIDGLNDAPLIATDGASLTEDTAVVVGSVLANDQDVDQSDSLSVVNAGTYEGLYGVLHLQANGDYRYEPDTAQLQSLAAGTVVQDVFASFVSDGAATGSSSLAITITGTNDVPLLQADVVSLSVHQGEISGNALSNDSDVDSGTQLQAEPASLQGQYGNLQLQADGSFRYVLTDSTSLRALADGEAVEEAFTYAATDGAAMASAALTVTITGSNDAPVAQSDGAAMTEDEAPIAGNVLQNDSDVDHGTVLEVVAPGQRAGQFGLLQLQIDGSYSYALDNGLPAVQALAAGQTLVESFAYDVTDGSLQAEAMLTITVHGRNDAPVAAMDQASLQEDLQVVATGNVLANDSDGDTGTSLSVQTPGTLQGLYGHLVIAADGSYRYELANSSNAVQALAGGERVTDMFSYAVSDGELSASANLTFSIAGTNDVPVAAADQAVLDEDTAEVLGNVLVNDHDADGSDSLSVMAGTLQGQYGSLQLAADGSYRYGLDNSRVQSLGRSQSQVETFSYQLTDGQATVSETVTLTINGLNDAPAASADAASLSEDTASVSGTVLANDQDVDSGDVLTVANAGSYLGQYGTLQLSANGGYVYQADTARLQSLAFGESVQEQFSCVVTDGVATSTSNLLITIVGTNDVPHVQADIASLQVVDGVVTGNVLVNDSDVDHGAQLQSTPAALTGQYGSLQLQADGSYRYALVDSAALRALAQGETVSENFLYQVSDGRAAASSSLTVTIVGNNDAPVAQADTASMTEDQSGVSGSLLVNDSDVDHGAVLRVAAPGPLQGQYGTLTLSENGSYAYALNQGQVQSLQAGQSVTETFAYQVTDGQSQSASVLTITIQGRNDAPVAAADTAALQEDAVLVATGNVLVNDQDVDAGSTLNVRTAGTLQGIYGQLVISADGSYRYDLANSAAAIQALAAGETVTESFQYVVADGTAADSLTATSSLTVQIAGRNDAPILVNAIADKAVNAGQAFALQLDAATFTDIDHNDVLTWSLTQADGSALPSWLQFNAQTRQLTSTTSTAAGNYTLRASVVDKSGAQASTSFMLAVNATQGVSLIGTPFNDVLTGTNYADFIDGRGAADVMIGKGGDDTYVVDDTLTLGVYTGPESCGFSLYIGDQVVEKAGEGYDTVKSTVSYVLASNVEALMLEGTWGISGTGNTLSNWIKGNEADNCLDGEEGDDHLQGGNGADTLRGDAGVDLLQGGAGNDWIADSHGNGLLDGGAGADTLWGNDQSNLFIGRQGNDRITLEGGNDVVVFNRGDGVDAIADAGYAGGRLVVSLGAGIAYSDLKFTRAGASLVLSVGNSESLTFEGWYGLLPNRPTVTLQMVAETMTGFSQTSSNSLLNDKVETFNFNQLAAKFDQQGWSNLWLTPWSLNSALTQFQLAGSDTAALGGNLAYQYGLTGSTAGIGATSAQTELGAAAFGSQMQVLRPLSGLADGISKLS